MGRYLPVFPLGTPVLPVQVLPLHIFEDRYRVLMDTLTSFGSAAELGVVMIERGCEVGGGDVRATVGTVTHLIESERLPDGRWVAIFAGSHRFEVQRWLPDDPYPQAVVEEAAEEEWNEADRGALVAADTAVREALRLAASVGQRLSSPDFVPSGDPVMAAWELCNRAPIGPLDRQSLLQTPARRERLERLTDIAGEAAQVLAFRLRGR